MLPDPTVYLFLAGGGAGLLGALLGFGGGIFLVPLLTVLFQVPIRQAVAASLVCVVTTSLAAETDEGLAELVDVALGLRLELAAAGGAVGAGLISPWISASWLAWLFAGVALLAALSFLVSSGRAGPAERLSAGGPLQAGPDTPRNLPLGVGLSLVAGAASGLLGIGGGSIQVPLLHLLLGVPLRQSIATSTFMVGLTGVAGAAVYFARGLIDPALTVPCALGVALGARLGAAGASRAVPAWLLRALLTLSLLVLAWQMAVRGGGAL